MARKINVKYVVRDSSQNLIKSNEIMPIGVISYETDTNKVKLSDGEKSYNNLPYVSSDSSSLNMDYSQLLGKPQINSVELRGNKSLDDLGIAAKNAVYTKEEVDAKVTSVYKYKGSVANEASLPSEGNVIGDVYNVEDTGANYAWDGSKWDNLGTAIDLTSYLTKEEADSTYATKVELGNKADKATSLVGYGIADAYTKGEVDSALVNKADVSVVEAKADKTTTDAMAQQISDIENNVSNLSTNVTDLGNFATAKEAEDEAARVGFQHPEIAIITYKVANLDNGFIINNVIQNTTYQILWYRGLSKQRTITSSLVGEWNSNENTIYIPNKAVKTGIFNLTTEATHEQIVEQLTAASYQPVTVEDLDKCLTKGFMLQNGVMYGGITVGWTGQAYTLSYIGMRTPKTGLYAMNIVIGYSDGKFSVVKNGTQYEILNPAELANQSVIMDMKSSIETLNTEMSNKVNTSDFDSFKQNAVVYMDYQYGDEQKRGIQLDNNVNIVGATTDGDSASLVMMSKWNKADFGSAKVSCNINTKDFVTVNDKNALISNDILSMFLKAGDNVKITEEEETYPDTEINYKVCKVSADLSPIQSELSSKVDTETYNQFNYTMYGNLDWNKYKEQKYVMQILKSLEQSYIDDLGKPENINGKPYDESSNNYTLGNSYVCFGGFDEGFTFHYDLWGMESGQERNDCGQIVTSIADALPSDNALMKGKAPSVKDIDKGSVTEVSALIDSLNAILAQLRTRGVIA